MANGNDLRVVDVTVVEEEDGGAFVAYFLEDEHRRYRVTSGHPGGFTDMGGPDPQAGSRRIGIARDHWRANEPALRPLYRRVAAIRCRRDLELWFREMEASVSQFPHVAVTAAFVIPDALALIDEPGSRRVGDRYRRWFDGNAAPHFVHDSAQVLTAAECYAIRCGMHHAGHNNAEGGRRFMQFDAARDEPDVIPWPYNNIDFLVMMPPAWFVGRMVEAARAWLDRVGDDVLSAAADDAALILSAWSRPIWHTGPA